MKRSPLTRKTPLQRSPMKRRKGSTKYSRRERDLEFMNFVRSELLCSVLEEWPCVDYEPTPCEGPIEADHMGPRGLSHKADDRTCAALCTKHHRERTDHTGSFKFCTKAEVRAWRERAILRAQTLFAERNGQEP